MTLLRTLGPLGGKYVPPYAPEILVVSYSVWLAISFEILSSMPSQVVFADGLVTQWSTLTCSRVVPRTAPLRWPRPPLPAGRFPLPTSKGPLRWGSAWKAVWMENVTRPPKSSSSGIVTNVCMTPAPKMTWGAGCRFLAWEACHRDCQAWIQIQMLPRAFQALGTYQVLVLTAVAVLLGKALWSTHLFPASMWPWVVLVLLPELMFSANRVCSSCSPPGTTVANGPSSTSTTTAWPNLQRQLVRTTNHWSRKIPTPMMRSWPPSLTQLQLMPWISISRTVWRLILVGAMAVRQGYLYFLYLCMDLHHIL